MRNHYQSSDIICRSDGVLDATFERFCIENKTQYVQGDRIKTLNYGGLWSITMLQLFLKLSRAEFLIRIEPDTVILRRLETLPDADVFARYQGGKRPYYQGGAMGFSRNAAKLILESKLLESEIYKQTSYGYQRFADHYRQAEEILQNEPLAATDIILSDVIAKLGFTVDDWQIAACFSHATDLHKWLISQSIDSLENYCFVHPVKCVIHPGPIEIDSLKPKLEG
ncbi:hypothetical protein [Oculatella sp. LEGE 06141]|uniref:hypothetical protein n=1 Tax=Oculatella sp. LEGE 06141 TaxID=1828648 RepID=UPI001882B75B|nr:hypothetical protein [Oculatella sp. LEGE 06141]